MGDPLFKPYWFVKKHFALFRWVIPGPSWSSCYMLSAADLLYVGKDELIRIQKICSRWLWKWSHQNLGRNCLFWACCTFVTTFQKSSAADVTESVYMRKRVNINPFPHIDAFWRLCSRQLFENIVTKEEIAQNVQFLLLPQCFQLWRFSMFWQNTFKVVCCRIVVWGKGLKKSYIRTISIKYTLMWNMIYKYE